MRFTILMTFAVVCSAAFAEGLKRGEGGLTFRPLLLAIDTNECSAIADVNGDGKPDVIAGRNWFANPEFKPRPLRNIGEFGKDYSENNGDHVMDVNGDGRPDVVAMSFIPTEIHWYENPGEPNLAFGKLWPQHLLINTGVSQNESTHVHDVDGDGTVEFLVDSWNPSNPMCLYRFGTDAQGKPVLTKHLIGESGNGHGIGFGDLNGDGRDDIVFGAGWYEQPASSPFNQTWKLHRDFTLPAKAPHASCPMIITDLDGDGRNDILWGQGHDYGLHWNQQLVPSEDGKLRFEQHLIDKSFSQPHCLHWTDLDGDGSPELITGKRVRAHSGGDPGADDPAVIYYYKFDRASKQWTRYTISDQNVGTGLQINTADVNGDGRIDIVVAGKSGTYILFNEG